MSELSFEHGWLLSALLVLPVLWFLMRAVPRSPVRRVFPGIFFLRRLKETDETPSRMPWWLLVLRMAVLALVIAGLAGPVMNAPQKAFAPAAQSLVILDNGWPAADGWEMRRETARRLAGQYGPGHQFWLALTAPAGAPAISGPMTGAQLEERFARLTPQPAAPDRAAVAPEVEAVLTRLGAETDIHWLSDNLFLTNDLGERRFAGMLQETRRLTSYIADGASPVLVTGAGFAADNVRVTVSRPGAASVAQAGRITVLSADGRSLSEEAFEIPAGEKDVTVALNLPLRLRNDISQIRIAGAQSAGAVWLSDATNRQSLAGIPSAGGQLAGTLLDGNFYIRQALAPHALFADGSLSDILDAGATVLLLDDVGNLRSGDRERLSRWIDEGGVLVRFSGPALAAAAEDAGTTPDSLLLPVFLRGTGRALGGTLTWETPQKIGGFEPESPLAGLEIDPEVTVRRQILARPQSDGEGESWAWLEDGTPLITARQKGKGHIVLFHVAATPDWSTLPVSGQFVEILRRLSALSQIENSAGADRISLQPLLHLDAFGRLGSPADDAAAAEFPLTEEDARPLPGLYGSAGAPRAVNALPAGAEPWTLVAIGAFDGGRLKSYDGPVPRAFGGWLLAAALVLFLLDMLASLALQGRLVGRQTALALLAAILLPQSVFPPDAMAQAPVSPKTIEAALSTRLAYVETGNRETDTISRAGLNALTRELQRRSALEPGPAEGVNLSTDDLSVYPLLYWPILPGTEVPGEEALYRLELFMAGGGIVVFDTMDGDRQAVSRETDEQIALRRILRALNIPPLEPLPRGHVLGRSFYLLEDLPGRNEEGEVWVEARQAGRSSNDRVTPVIIGGRDWAAAWAVDDSGRPMRPLGAGGYLRRDYALRAGINMVMTALTGNYKVDQLQVENLLDQLGEEQREGTAP